MTVFITIAVLLALAAAAFVSVPLWRAGARLAAVLLAGCLPLLAFGLYAANSNWDWTRPAAPAAAHMPGSLEQVVKLLAERLAERPDDVAGWKLLGRSRAVLGDFAGARDAFAAAYTRTAGGDPEAIVGYGEALVMLDEMELDGRAGRLFEDALRLAPDEPRALWYGGLGARRRGDGDTARLRWQALQRQELPAEIQQAVAERLKELDAVTPPAGDAG